MRILNNNELLDVTGGATWSGAFFSSVAKAINTVLDVGRSFGSAIRRLVDGSICPV